MAWVATLPFNPIGAGGVPATWVRVTLYTAITALMAVGVVATVSASARQEGFPWRAIGLPLIVAAGVVFPIVTLAGGREPGRRTDSPVSGGSRILL
jgi:peptidoglycan/LPS O-acetylase OafA/YrhL